MTIEEAQAEAVRRWGPNAQAVESWQQGISHFTVGVRMTGESKFLPAIAGKGDSWEAAFADADRRHPEPVNRPLCRACHGYIYAAQQKCPRANGFCEPLEAPDATA